MSRYVAGTGRLHTICRRVAAVVHGGPHLRAAPHKQMVNTGRGLCAVLARWLAIARASPSGSARHVVVWVSIRDFGEDD